MTQSKPKRSLQTRIVRAEDQITPGFESFAVPVARASTVVFPDLAAMRACDWRNDAQWRYGLHATPTSLALAQRLAAIEGGKHALLQPSGLSSISNVYFGLVKAGDDVLIPDNVYSPNRDHGDWLARDFGITARYYDPMIGAGIADLIQPNTRLIWLEAPGSVTMEVPDVGAITAAARARNVITAIDNTWSAGLAFRPFEHGVDISVQALTKYQSGGGDVLMGATITAERELHLKLKAARMRMGIGVSSDDCSLILRSLPSMQVRFEQHDRSALAIAKWLKARPEIAAVLHPAFPDLFRARGRFHLLTSNPPYISRLQYDSLALSVKKFEDQRALLADEGGLAFYHAIAKLARRGNILTSDGLVVLEVGDDQAKAVQEIMQAVGGFSKTEIWLDPCGKERVVLATNSANLTN